MEPLWLDLTNALSQHHQSRTCCLDGMATMLGYSLS